MKKTKDFTNCYAVIFVSERTDFDEEGYQKMAVEIENLVHKQNGFLGLDFGKDEKRITISYWETLEDIKNWKNNPRHQKAIADGKAKWYKNYSLRICKIEKSYDWELL
ncbi:antibiotic biosynthesis monooxygenase family protein [Aureivirga sp. CE67]|uniref:antibiotic biosynthesis monooxygenase family protein n=1 Tax=Aureivirga sp. CE67 TaxID=1788983 RepID=UPI0018C9BF0F|nr:antibiotic biosynthesis monooxygenase [Aureivirga sp. CE67]